MESSNPILQRLEDQISWYSHKSRFCQRAYQRSEFFGIICASLIPLLMGLDLPYSRVLISTLAILIVMSRVLTTLQQYQANSIFYRSTCESLKHEKFMYLAVAGPYAYASSPMQMLAERTEGLVSHEHSQWQSIQQAVSKAAHSSALVKESRETLEADADDFPIEEEVVNNVFNAIKTGRGSGWEVTRAVAADPDRVKRALNVLRRRGLVESNGIGLDGYYHLTSSGFGVRDTLAGRS
jgi:hypothetical protein